MPDNSRNSSLGPAMERAQRALDDADFRPLSTRSLLLSFLLGTHPPELHVAHLTSFGEHFGVREGTVRTALSRMVSAGEVTTDGAGRYRLAGRMVERQAQQDRGLADPPATWDGTWWTAIVVDSDRSATERRHFRTAMTGARMGELRPETWMRPANLAGPDLRDDLLLTRGTLVGDASQLVDRLWEIDDLEDDAERWICTFDDLDLLLDAADHEALPISFDVSAAVVRFLRTEPQLPVQLAAMPNCAALRARYREFNVSFRASLDAWLRTAA